MSQPATDPMPADESTRPVRQGVQRLANGLTTLGIAGLALLLLAAVIIGLWHWLNTTPPAQIEVRGELGPNEREQLTAKLAPLAHSGYFTTDLSRLRDAALGLPWIHEVTLIRSWPDRIVVRPLLYHPIARWGSSRLLSDNGVVYHELESRDRSALPLMHGPVNQSVLMMNQYQRITAQMATLGLQVRDLYLTERMTWFIQFDQGLRVIVDNQQTDLKLQRLAQLLQGPLAGALPAIAVIDLRYQNGLAVQWRPEAAQSGPQSLMALSAPPSFPESTPAASPRIPP